MSMGGMSMGGNTNGMTVQSQVPVASVASGAAATTVPTTAPTTVPTTAATTAAATTAAATTVAATSTEETTTEARYVLGFNKVFFVKGTDTYNYTQWYNIHNFIMLYMLNTLCIIIWFDSINNSVHIIIYIYIYTYIHTHTIIYIHTHIVYACFALQGQPCSHRATPLAFRKRKRRRRMMKRLLTAPMARKRCQGHSALFNLGVCCYHLEDVSQW